jgi:hypothetical protein
MCRKMQETLIWRALVGGRRIRPALRFSDNDNHADKLEAVCPPLPICRQARVRERGDPVSGSMARRSPASSSRRCRMEIDFGKTKHRSRPGDGTRASANTSGPDSTRAAKPAVELRSLQEEDPHRAKKTCFFCRTGSFGSDCSRAAIRPFDLMSRRHPLFVNQGDLFEIRLREANQSGKP